jgi:acyl-CoA reductase-like NAD-dependent aldehyde dehydrogenase
MSRSHQEWQNAAAALQIDTRPVIAARTADFADPGASFATVNPANGAEVARYPDCGRKACEAAYAQSRAAYPSWAALPLSARSSVFNAWADLIVAEAETLALMDCLEMGMPISTAVEDVVYSADILRETASLAASLTLDAGVTAPGTTSYNIAEPLGVILAITPWNFPVNQVLAKIAPPLIMGNAVVLKPSEVACASALRLADLALQAGLPAGVLNVVPGTGRNTGAALSGMPGFDRIVFTGSEATGAAIQAQAGASGRARPMAMELGGKSPNIVCASFRDVEALGPALAQRFLWNSGQVCSAGTRLLVHESLADRLVAAVTAAMADYAPGDPLDPETTFGPIATAAQHRRVTGFVAQAQAAGLQAVTSGPAAGLYVAPTLVDHVPADAPLACNEIFGPVLAVSRFSTTDEAAALAQASGYGLTAEVWTRDLAEAQFLIRAIPAASVTVHSSLGARGEGSPALALEPRGKSGFGVDFGRAGLLQFVQLKLATINT